MGTEALRIRWRDIIGTAPPRSRSPMVLRYEIGWALQARRHGDLDSRTLRALRARVRDRTREAPQAELTSIQPTLAVGSTLLREWRGETHRVKVTEGGFEYRGKSHKSLSAIARLITGVRWSGPRFFQLRGEPG